jgi:hypothetical protein
MSNGCAAALEVDDYRIAKDDIKLTRELQAVATLNLLRQIGQLACNDYHIFALIDLGSSKIRRPYSRHRNQKITIDRERVAVQTQLDIGISGYFDIRHVDQCEIVTLEVN